MPSSGDGIRPYGKLATLLLYGTGHYLGLGLRRLMLKSALLAERWFRDLKHNCIYQTEYRNMRELRHVIAQYVDRYNFRRLHSSLDYSTPAEWYFSGINSSNAPTDKMMKWAA